MSCGIEKELGSPYKPLYVDGLNLKKKKKILETQIFFKTSSLSKEVLFSSKEALSKVLKPPLSTLEVYKE
jgi:hypothetical protein